jgi:hypothetical protein
MEKVKEMLLRYLIVYVTLSALAKLESSRRRLYINDEFFFEGELSDLDVWIIEYKLRLKINYTGEE